MQCKDIDDIKILSVLKKNVKSSAFSAEISEVSVFEGFPPETPNKLMLAKMKSLINKGLADGCACGCRGDFTITELGNKRLKEANETTFTS